MSARQHTRQLSLGTAARTDEVAMKFVPETYEEWKQCITVLCDIPLTPSYVQERISALGNMSDYHTQRFVERWGEAHYNQTLVWFRQAEEELKG